MSKGTATVAVIMSLVVAGCSTAGSTTDPMHRQISDLQAENTSLKEQVKSLEQERDALKKQGQGSPGMPAQIKVSREQAIAIALTNAPNSAIKDSRLVEFFSRNPERGIAVWVLDLMSADKRPQGTLIIDATTGQVLSASNAHSGQ